MMIAPTTTLIQPVQLDEAARRPATGPGMLAADAALPVMRQRTC
jgi:hypothetical protein